MGIAYVATHHLFIPRDQEIGAGDDVRMDHPRVAYPFLLRGAEKQRDALHLTKRKLGHGGRSAIDVLIEKARRNNDDVVFVESVGVIGVANGLDNLAGGIFAHQESDEVM